MAVLGASSQALPRSVAIYARVSTEDQADRGTVEAQRGFLRDFARLYDLVIADEYVDDGISGVRPLGERPEGQRLLEDARQGRFGEVLVYRLDRLGRSLSSLLDAHDTLETAGVTIRSATEPFDTSTPIGRFLFQLLGSLAELEKSTITERMGMGRDRVAKSGKWTGGPIPFGFDLDDQGCLAPSQRPIEGLGLIEADVARSVFVRIADGSSTVAEARRLNELRVPTHRRYGGGKVVTVGDTWLPSRVNQMVKNEVYAGVHVLRSKRGPISREVPALVERGIWQRANDQLGENRALATRNAKRRYLLRGLITCGACGAKYVGSSSRRSSGWTGHYYRCGSQLGSVHPETKSRCRGKNLPAEEIEATIWRDCRYFIDNPGEPLEEAKRELRERLSRAAGAQEERRHVERLIADKEVERERVMTLYRRGTVTLEVRPKSPASHNW